MTDPTYHLTLEAEEVPLGTLSLVRDMVESESKLIELRYVQETDD